MVSATNASIAAPSSEMLPRIAQRPACVVEQADGLANETGAYPNAFLVVFRCNEQKWTVSLIEGKFPIPDKPNPSLYRLLEARDLLLPKGGRVDLAVGACRAGEKPLKATIAVAAIWGDRKVITQGAGLIEVLGVKGHQPRLEDLKVTELSCFQDEP